MRKEYRKAATRLFAEGLARRLPAYQPWKPALPLIARGGGKAFFRRPAGPAGCVFIVLAPNTKQDDAFFVELGWSAYDRVPEVTVWPTDFATPERTELLVAAAAHHRPTCGAPLELLVAAASHDRPTCAAPLELLVAAASHDRPTCAAPLQLSQPEGVARLGDLSGKEMWSTGALEQAMAAADEGAMLAYLQEQLRPLSASEAEAAMRPLVEDALYALERWGCRYLDAAAERLAGSAR